MDKKQADKIYRIRLNAFKNSCRTYQIQKRNTRLLSEKYAVLKDIVKVSDDGTMTVLKQDEKDPDYLSPILVRMYQYMVMDLYFVEDTLRKIREESGEEAEKIVREVLIDGIVQETAGKDHGLSRWQLQTESEKWLRKALMEERDEVGEDK